LKSSAVCVTPKLHQAKARHKTVIAFLEALGVPSSAAQADAEGIEHHVCAETLDAFEKFLAAKLSADASKLMRKAE